MSHGKIHTDLASDRAALMTAGIVVGGFAVHYGGGLLFGHYLDVPLVRPLPSFVQAVWSAGIMTATLGAIVLVNGRQ